MPRQRILIEQLRAGQRVYVGNLDVFGRVSEDGTKILCEAPMLDYVHYLSAASRIYAAEKELSIGISGRVLESHMEGDVRVLDKVEMTYAWVHVINREPQLRAALLTLLDQVDYMAGACSVTEMVGAVLSKEVIARAREALR